MKTAQGCQVVKCIVHTFDGSILYLSKLWVQTGDLILQTFDHFHKNYLHLFSCKCECSFLLWVWIMGTDFDTISWKPNEQGFESFFIWHVKA
jgi:hypothetical protein